MKKKKRSYIKLFNIPDVANRALAMLSEKPPQPYSVIASKLGCDRSSVIHFHKKKIKQGISLENFNGVQVEIVGGIKTAETEVVNRGRNYKDYLKGYLKKRNRDQAKLMKEAKKTIDKVRKNRVDVDIDYDFEFDIYDF